MICLRCGEYRDRSELDSLGICETCREADRLRDEGWATWAPGIPLPPRDDWPEPPDEVPI